MAYSDFDLKKVRNNFGLQIDEQPDLFAEVTPVQPSVTLANTLAETAHLAMAINTEKARSEMLIIPVLLERATDTQCNRGHDCGSEKRKHQRGIRTMCG